MTDQHSAGEQEIRSEVNLHEAELRGQERGVKMAIANIKNRNLGVLSNDFESAVNAFEERIKRAERARGAEAAYRHCITLLDLEKDPWSIAACLNEIEDLAAEQTAIADGKGDEA